MGSGSPGQSLTAPTAGSDTQRALLVERVRSLVVATAVAVTSSSCGGDVAPESGPRLAATTLAPIDAPAIPLSHSDPRRHVRLNRTGTLGSSPERIADYATRLRFLRWRPGRNSGCEHRFSCDDAGLGAPRPGVRVNTVRFPGFCRELFQSDLAAGFSPADSLVLHPTSWANCG